MAVAFDAHSWDNQAIASFNVSHTPVGTPRGVLVFVMQYAGTHPNNISVTYGGVAMTEITGSPAHSDYEPSPPGELVVTRGFFLGTGIPTGVQNCTVTNPNTDSLLCSVTTVTASYDTKVENTAKIEEGLSGIGDITTNLALNGYTCFVAEGIMSGLQDRGNIQPLSGWTSRVEEDPGSGVWAMYSYDTVAASDVNIGFNTTVSDDVALIGAAIREEPKPDIDGDDITIYANIVDGNSGNVVISNLGVDALEISNVVVGGDSEFTYSGTTTATINPSNSQSFSVDFLPTAYPGTYSGTLTFTSNDPDESTYVVNITGIAESTTPIHIPGGPLPSTPISPDTPAFYGADPPNTSGLVAKLGVRKNTDFETRLWAQGESGSVTHVMVGHTVLATNTPLTAVDMPSTGYSVFVLESDIEVSVQIDSFTFSLEGCFVLGGASLTTFKLGNPSTMREAVVKFYGSK